MSWMMQTLPGGQTCWRARSIKDGMLRMFAPDDFHGWSAEAGLPAGVTVSVESPLSVTHADEVLLFAACVEPTDKYVPPGSPHAARRDAATALGGFCMEAREGPDGYRVAVLSSSLLLLMDAWHRLYGDMPGPDPLSSLMPPAALLSPVFLPFGSGLFCRAHVGCRAMLVGVHRAWR